MDSDQFEEIANAQLDLCRAMLVVKGREYAIGPDRLHNFKMSAALQRCTPRMALGGMLSKHIISVYDMIDAVDCARPEVWNEKITDSINYLILLRAMAAEELNENGKI